MTSAEYGPGVLEMLDELRSLLAETRTIAVVGLSDDPDRESNSIAAYLRTNGYGIVAVNPGCREVFGDPCHASLSAIPDDLRRRIDLVAVFRRPDAVPPILEEAARLGLRRVWLQVGVSSRAAMETAARLGLTLVSNKCLRVVHGLSRKTIEEARRREAVEAPDRTAGRPGSPSGTGRARDPSVRE